MRKIWTMDPSCIIVWVTTYYKHSIFHWIFTQSRELESFPFLSRVWGDHVFKGHVDMLRRCGEPQSLTMSQRCSPHVSINEKQATHSAGLANKFHTIQRKNLKNFLVESNLIPARDAWRAQTNLVRTRTQRPHRDWARTVFEYFLQMYGSAVVCCRGRGSGCSRPGYGISPLGGGHH